MSKHHQPFKILTSPTLVNVEDVYPNKGVLVKEANDKFYRIDEMALPKVYGFFGLLGIFCGIWFLDGKFNWKEDSLSVFLIILGSFLFIYRLTVKSKHKELVLDRLNGTVSYPDSFYGKPLQGKFSELKAVISISGDIDGAPGDEKLKFVNTFKPRKIDILRTISYDDPYQEWSLFVWYMDKNRPLPPGTAFDPYRQQDFERRKALGFPKLLYKSTIPTPEFTKEQQAERRRIAGW
ncbi:hypothetical protein HER15_11970 [Tenacibaculum mesophilum]|uniref:Uncharacterized protein n=1 Tax=Tenacibaculum mesophilum TaxID=104268 RepID=A0AAE9MKU2_9FLAO|nr:hypothetical protein [Tenacibaculum mesophilum]UTD13953.1 hypothetical protein HER15_11970 [Tenacibaculum mesophilum]